MTIDEAIERLEYVKANALIQRDAGVSQYWRQEIDGTIETIDMAIKALADRKTEPQADTHLQRLQMCADCEHTDMCEWCHSRWAKDEPQTEERTIQGTGDCEHCSRLFVDCAGR